MKAYEIGEEVFAVVMESSDNADVSLMVPSVTKSKIINRVEPDEDPANFQYELEGNDGMIKAKKIFTDVNIAKTYALDAIKDPNIRAGMKKKLDSKTW